MSDDYQIKVTREGRLKKELAKYERAIPPALAAAAMVVITRTQRIHVLFRPVGWATGHMVRSYTYNPPVFDGTFFRTKVGSTQEYGFWAHFGRPPGKYPPPDAMLDWVKEKHIAGTWEITGAGRGGYPRYKRVGTKSQIEREDKDVAFLIGRKIAREGTKGFPALLVGFRQSKDAALAVFTRTLLAQVGGESVGL